MDECNQNRAIRSPANSVEENALDPLLTLEPPSETPSFSLKNVVLLLGAYLGVGTVAFFLLRHQMEGEKTDGFVDALYFCVVTMTTVGFGDLVPQSTLAKLMACVYVFAGMIIVGLYLGKAADRLVENQEALLVRAMNLNNDLVLYHPTDVHTHDTRKKFILALLTLVMLVISGTIFLSKTEGKGIMDSFYCVCCTITTLGYGDENFSTKAGRVFAIFWMLSGTICLAQCFCYIAEMQTEKRQQEVVKRILSKKLTSSDLEVADLDHDKTVSASEFIVFKLQEMGKINEMDISKLMEKFRELDVDESGTLTVEDLKL